MPEPSHRRLDLSRLPRYTQQESDDFVAARDLINAVIAVYSSLIYKARNEEEKRRLREEQRVHIAARRDLTVYDQEEVRRVRAECPSLLQELRARNDG